MLRLEIDGLDEVIAAIKRFPGALNPFIKKACPGRHEAGPEDRQGASAPSPR